MDTSPEKPTEEIPAEAPVLSTRPSQGECLRQWLQSNKIFFETVAAFLLSLMAVIISVAQIAIAVKQTALTEVQTDVAKQQAIPQFIVKKVLGYDQSTQMYMDDSITITNQGGIAQTFNVEVAVFFKVTITQIGGSQKTVALPINGYYVADRLTGAGIGLLATIEGIKNNDRFVSLDRDFSKLAEEKNLYADITLQRCVSLQYQDIFNESHTKYFQINHVGGSTPLDNEAGAALFKQYKSAYSDGTMVQFEKLTPENLLERISR